MKNFSAGETKVGVILGVIAILLIIALIIAFIILVPKVINNGGTGGRLVSATTTLADAKTVGLAQCLAQNKVIMYGAYWCPHCQNQKELFSSAWEDVSYVECTEESKRCLAAGIKGYPTWIRADGEVREGEMPLSDLAAWAGCPF